jgi:lipopolysaccharide/colanic/teichoic acid biosynthesis glycosyltransferase
MRAVIIATGHVSPQAQFSPRHSPPLLPLLDRPFLQHVIEYIAGMGVLSFDILLSNEPEKYEALLGDGRRWGCRFTLRLVRDAARPYGMLHTSLAQQVDGRVLIAHANMLPAINAGMLKSSGTTLVCAPGPGNWTGWAIADACDMADVPSDAAALEHHLISKGAARAPCDEMLSVNSYTDLIASQRTVLAGGFTGLLLGGQRAADGVWLSRNVNLHPTARLTPPVYICADCRIGPGVSLGPNAVIGPGCILDSHCTIADSAVLPGSYVGEMLELNDCIIDRNMLVNTRIGGALSVSDDFILGSVSSGGIGSVLARTVSRLSGALLLTLLWPLLCGTMLWLKLFRKGPVFFSRDAVMLPAGEDPLQWKTFRFLSFDGHSDGRGLFPRLRHFLLQFLPAIWQVARGTMCIVGVAPRSPAHLISLPGDWQGLYCAVKPGIITESMVVYGLEPTQDELYAAEAFYAVSAGLRHDVKLFCAYFAGLFKRSQTLESGRHAATMLEAQSH